MNNLIYNKTLFIDTDNPNDENYKKIIENNRNFNNKNIRNNITQVYVNKFINDGCFGYINISKKKTQRQLNPNYYIGVESSSEEDDIDYSKIIVNGFILFKEDDEKFNTIEIGVVFRDVDMYRGFGSELMNLAVQYCKEFNYEYCELNAINSQLVDYYERFGFEFISRNMDDHLMRLKI